MELKLVKGEGILQRDYYFLSSQWREGSLPHEASSNLHCCLTQVIRQRYLAHSEECLK